MTEARWCGGCQDGNLPLKCFSRLFCHFVQGFFFLCFVSRLQRLNFTFCDWQPGKDSSYWSSLPLCHERQREFADYLWVVSARQLAADPSRPSLSLPSLSLSLSMLHVRSLKTHAGSSPSEHISWARSKKFLNTHIKNAPFYSEIVPQNFGPLLAMGPLWQNQLGLFFIHSWNEKI